ncbi:hypothetical protein MBLNU459_g3024t2 [Dothideomycetes sp. NU459]
MSEEAELQAKIAALAGRINQQKQGNGNVPYSRAQAPGYQPAPTRWTPYGTYQQSYSRGGGHAHYQRSTYSPAHRNRTLVVNNGASTPDKTNQTPTAQTSTDAGWISKRDRHMQLINTSVYDQKTQQRRKEMEETAIQKQTRRDDREKSKVIRFIEGKPAYGTSTGSAVLAASRELIIHNLKFRISTDGSKLIRLFGESSGTSRKTAQHILIFTDGSNDDAQSTPKQAEVAGVVFHRSTCPRGPQCRFTHDVAKVAICKDFLRTGECVVGEEACNFSHDLSPHRVPTCLHFVRGNCTNAECPYAHVNINPAASTCRAFATMGYCEKGAACAERHVNECPDYADKGICRNKNCRLPHVDTAANQRKAMAAKAGKTGATDDNESSDMSSDEEEFQLIDSDDVDSDDFDEDVAMAGSGEPDHALSRQQDFISFS